jgi:hypothetical protein
MRSQHIWVPVIMFENTKDKFLSFTDEKTLIVVEKQSGVQFEPGLSDMEEQAISRK